VLRIPSSLERRLAEIFPKIKDREQFVKETINEALEKYEPATEEPDTEMTIGGTLHLFSDGGSRGNPGQAAIAWIIEDPIRGEVLKEGKQRIGVETNNVAEYRALIEGLKAAEQFHPNRLLCHLDSELVVKQLNGEYRVKMATLQPFFEEIKKLADELPDVVFVHIPREDNYRADALVNRALDELPAPAALDANRPSLPQQSLFNQRSVERPGDMYRDNVRGSGR
jgi:ribonuclease HI